MKNDQTGLSFRQISIVGTAFAAIIAASLWALISIGASRSDAGLAGGMVAAGFAWFYLTFVLPAVLIVEYVVAFKKARDRKFLHGLLSVLLTSVILYAAFWAISGSGREAPDIEFGSPYPSSVIKSPVTVEGTIGVDSPYGTREFKIFVLDAEGRVLGNATVSPVIMGEDLSDYDESQPFSVTIDFKEPATPTGVITTASASTSAPGTPYGMEVRFR